jgi:hypothetical protein
MSIARGGEQSRTSERVVIEERITAVDQGQMTTIFTFSGTLLPPASNVDTTMCEFRPCPLGPKVSAFAGAVSGATFTGLATAMQREGIDLCQYTW